MGTLLFLLLCGLALGDVDESLRVDCHPEPGGTQQICESRQCLWNAPQSAASPVGTPSCFYPRESGYTLSSQSGSTFTLSPSSPNPYGNNLDSLKVKVGSVGKTLTVSIGTSSRYVPPVGFPKNPSTSTDSLIFTPTAVPNSQFFSFQVVRNSTNTVIWDTSIGGMQFADKFIQIATYLPSKNLFGFGDHVHKKLKHDLSRYTTWPMFARDIPPDSGSPLSTQNLYGVHPFYLMLENDGKAHGVLILNSNAQEVTTGPGPHLVYRTIGGQLDLAFFPGPLPEQVIQQYLSFIGTPFLPAYWALGFQLSRWGYGNLTAMQAAVSRTQAAGVPLDIPYADIDYMRGDEDFTEGNGWTGFPDYAAQLHQQGLHLILIFDPAIEVDYDSFQRALDKNVSFVEWPSKNLVPTNVQNRYPMAKDTLIMLGNVWPVNNTAFPDFLDPSSATSDWWTAEFQRFHNSTPFDGIWIDMNEPSNMETTTYTEKGSQDSGVTTPHLSCPIAGPDSLLDNPPYQTWAVYGGVQPGQHLCTRTLCMLGKTVRRSQDFYDTKNLYGWSESRVTATALRKTTNKRGAVISRSTFPSSGRYAGHWLGDNTARWGDLQTSVIGVMEFNFFGIPYVGSDICGFTAPTTEELCLRWHQMGAFHPFSRNHNMKGMPPQDPGQWPSVANAAKIALTFRYYYLPYLYSLHYRSSLLGGTVIRPLFFEFPQEAATQDVDEQFLWGSCLMIAPAVKAGQLTVDVYFPQDTWYSLIPESYGTVQQPGKRAVEARKDSLTPVFARGGCILPRQAANSTTTASRLNPMELLILSTSDMTPSTGELFWDAGDDPVDDLSQHQRHHWQFTLSTTSSTGNLTGACSQCSSNVAINSLDVIEISGYNFYPDFSKCQLNGQKVNVNVQTSSYSAITRRLYLKTSGLIPLSQFTGSSFTLAWPHNPIS